MYTLSIATHCNEKKCDKICKQLASHLCHSKKNSFKSVTMSESAILQKHQYVHALQYDITIAPCSLVPTILHEFHDSKVYQWTFPTFDAIRSYWWPKLWQDIVKYIGQCNICAKHLQNMARYPQQHLEVLQTPMAVLTMDIIGF